MGGIVLAQNIRIKVTAKQCQVKELPAAEPSILDPEFDWPAIGRSVEAEVVPLLHCRCRLRFAQANPIFSVAL